MKKKNGFDRYTALYERLSKDDEQQGESNSIINQKQFLEGYCVRNSFENYRHFTDDGYTGKNFNRPGFQEMLSEIEAGNIETVIVKDMSRFGRNYLEVGFYTEIMFPKNDVRFIAINNNVDSDKPQDNDFTPFLNIMNEWYVRDTSNKIKAVFLARMRDGKRCSAAIPYGYNRDPNDKNKLVVDPVAAPIVKRIFELADQGNGPTMIARTLTEDKVLIPTAYTLQYHPEQCNRHSAPLNYNWNSSTIAQILRKEEYLGHTILRKTISTNFKTDSRRPSTEDEKFFFPNTHEPIISQELWDRVQKKRKRLKRIVPPGANTKRDKYAGILLCADCRSRMKPCRYQVRDGSERISYQCGAYELQTRKCFSHSIKESDVDAVVLKVLRGLFRQTIKDEEKLAEKLRDRFQKKEKEDTKKEQSELNSLQKRDAELSMLIQSLYENFASGLIPERQYKMLMKNYSDEQEKAGARIAEIEKSREEVKGTNYDIGRFVAAIKQFKEPKEVTRELLEGLIDCILVHKPTGGRSHRTVELDICFNFIGNYEVVIPPEMIAAEKRRKAKQEKEYIEQKKERAREYRIRKRDERRAQREGHKYDKKICEWCGAEYWPNGTTQKFCSDECCMGHAKARTKEKRYTEKGDHLFREKHCRICGKPFWPSSGQEEMCSKECKKRNARERAKIYYADVYSEKQREKSRKKRELNRILNEGHPYPKQVCEFCGEEYWPVRPSQKYCSKQCGSRGYQCVCQGRDPKEKEGHKFYKKTCIVCGSSFWPTGPSQAFCSDECRNKQTRDRNKERSGQANAKKLAEQDGHRFAQKTCEYCGKEYWPEQSNQVYCSYDCREHARFKKRTGHNYSEKEGHPYEKRTCKCCGSEFWPAGPNTKTCSEQCRKMIAKEQNIEFRRRQKLKKEVAWHEENETRLVRLDSYYQGIMGNERNTTERVGGAETRPDSQSA